MDTLGSQVVRKDKTTKVAKPLLRPQNRHKRLLWKEVQTVRRRHPERLSCPIHTDT